MRRSRYALALAIAGDVGLLAALLLWAAPFTPGPRLWLVALCALPPLVALNGLARARTYSAGWASMLALLYLAYALTEYVAGVRTPALLLCLGGSLALFVGAVVFVRWQARERPPPA